MTDASRTLIEEGRKLRASGDRKASLQAFIAAAEADTANAIAFIESGYDHLHLVQIPEARAAFERGLVIDPDNKPALIGLGHTFRHLRQLDHAEQSFRRVLELELGHGGASAGLGYTLKSLSRFDEALSAFQAAAKASTSNTSLLVEIAHLLRDLGRSGEAVEMLNDIVARDPSNVAHLLTLARLLKQIGKSQEAADIFRKLVTLNPTDLGLRIELGHRLLDIEELAEARILLDEVLKESPQNISALNVLGWVHRKAKQNDLAVACFREITSLQPTNIGAMRALGMIARERNDHETSLQIFQQASQCDPEAQDLQLEMGNCLQKLERFADAASEFNRILTKWPGTRAAHLGLGYALRGAGSLEEALDAFDDADRDDPTQPHASIEAGHILLRLARPNEAEQRFCIALGRAPGNVSALVGLSYALRRLGRLAEAESALRDALTAQPANNGARVALGHLLEAQYRLEEAADMFSAVVDSQPDHADSLAALGNIHRRRGDRGAAFEFFQKAAVANPANKARLIDVAVELRDLGQLEECETILDDVLSTLPTEPRALMQRGLLRRRQDRRQDALQVFIDLLKYHPENVQAMIEAATDERALGHPDVAGQWLERALRTETDHPGALTGLAEIATQRDDPEAALELYTRAAAAHPTHVWARLGAARTAFELGRRDEAFRMIAEAREQLGPHPEMVGLEVELMRNLRNWARALELLDSASSSGRPPNFWIWSHKAQILTITGAYKDAAAVLDAPPSQSVMDRARVALFKGQNAEAQFHYDDAIAAYQESIRLNPGDAWPHFELSRAALMSLDLQTSRKALGNFVSANRSSFLLKKQSLNLSQNHVGQLLDEFMLDAEALAQLRRARLRPIESQLPALQEIVTAFPDYTPAAIIAAIALRQAGRFDPPSISEANQLPSPIPRQVVQFWDSDPPQDVREIMAAWTEQNPSHGWTCFDNDTARDFLQSAFGGEVTAAYERIRMPAQKADLFRLAYLAACGGIYADADDRCLAPLDSFIRSDATLVVHQENYGSIGNNFIAATPEHPVIMRALDMAVAAMKRGDNDLVWLSTGPGLLTRAFALEWAAPRAGDLLRRAQVLDLGALQRVIGIHCPVRYKSTEKHWSRSAFGNKRKRA